MLVIRVLVVEDSPSARQLIVRLLESDPGIEVVGIATDGEEAVALAARLRPDVVTMDIHMPRLDGVSATRRIMAEGPLPIVIVSASADPNDARGKPFEAMQAGAVAVTEKPPGPGHPNHAAAARGLITTVKLMAGVKVVGRRLSAGHPICLDQPAVTPAPTMNGHPLAIALAASTGGPPAIQAILRAVGPDLEVPVLVVQHMSHGFTAGMVTWLGSTCPQLVRLAGHGDLPAGGTVYLAPEDHHLVITRRGTLLLSKAPAVNGFRPSADVLFESVAECYGARAVGVILTGMGNDGAAGLARLRDAGGFTIAQDECTSVVYGMPGAAAARGAVGRVLPLPEIGAALRRLLGLGVKPG